MGESCTLHAPIAWSMVQSALARGMRALVTARHPLGGLSRVHLSSVERWWELLYDGR